MHPEPADLHAPLDTRTYPELAADAGDPLVGLNRIAGAAGAALAPSRPWGRWDASQDSLAVAVESGRGTCFVTFERHQHVIGVRFTLPWIGNALAGTVPALQDAVALLDAWHNRLPLDEMGRQWPTLTTSPFAVALEQGRAIPYKWQEIRSLPAGLIDSRLVEAAFAAPQLRALFPVVSHGALTFSDTPIPPHPDHFPRASPHGEHGWIVDSAEKSASDRLVAATAEEAADCLLRLLPGS
ncbi:DUF6193 family natural product biosynthesis protein [Streptomyces sp. NRRL S-87]|uniref:DUF6193 family natural product biosynthesis protein n=1 Tax=Streptomyces sp. NRRL S-87 TaxID=1463920 RepID=UPI0004BE5831|nr:DUF6193 family natural product biosynthesis protein [Streptomyces sp. NRRL S-87]